MKNTTIQVCSVLLLLVAVGMSFQFIYQNNTSFDTVTHSQEPQVIEKTIERVTLQTDSQELDNLRAHIKKIEAQLSALQSRQENSLELDASASHLDYRNQTSPAKSPEDENYQFEQKVARQQSLYEARLMTEEIDQEWASNTLAQVEETLSSDNLSGLDLVEGTCGSTLCQLRLSANNGMDFEESMQRLSVDRSWEGPTFFSVDGEGNIHLFFARAGHDLPDELAM